MNGIALLMLAATLGVEYDWRTTDDNQIEYVLIVEPDTVTALAEGSEIRSSVPPELDSLQRLCIRIAPAPGTPAGRAEVPRKLPTSSLMRTGLRASADPVTILWRANGQPEENFSVKYGWQPTKSGELEYFVQLDPKFLRTLAPGDEIYTLISTEAGRVDTFVVFSNTKQLPRVAGRPAPLTGATQPAAGATAGTPGAARQPFGGAPLASAPPTAPSTNLAAGSPAPFATGFGAAGTNPAAPGAFSPATGNPAPPLNSGAASSPPAFERPGGFGGTRGFGATTDTTLDRDNSRVNPVNNYEPVPPPTTGPNGYGQTGLAGDTNRFDMTRPNMQPSMSPPGTTPNDYRNPGMNGSGLNSGLNPGGMAGTGMNNMGPAGGFQQPENPRRELTPPGGNDLFPSGTNFANNGFGGTNNYGPNSTNPAFRNNDPAYGAVGSATYRPGVGTPPDNLAPPRGYNETSLGNNPPSIDYRPQTPPDNRLASLSNTPLSRATSELDNRSTTAAPAQPEEKPYWWLLLSLMMLFFSIGANLYLGWTLAEFYSRYRLAVERLRSSGRT
jgi:hypothetical protein